jgi:hypothetical protein
MNKHKLIQRMHLIGLMWLGLSLLYIMVVALRRAGVEWWVIFSLSGYSALLFALLISLYLFALYRGVARTHKIEIEHPLTTSSYYIIFYVAAPLLGGLTGFFSGIGEPLIPEFFLDICIASLGAAFLVWVIVDSLAGFVEVLTPQGLKHRSIRLAKAKEERERKQKERQFLLNEVIAKEEQDLQSRQQLLAPMAERLAELLITGAKDFELAQQEAVEMGVRAWQIGGLSCMRQLKDMTIAIYTKKYAACPFNDYISGWWDGIGNWRKSFSS